MTAAQTSTRKPTRRWWRWAAAGSVLALSATLTVGVAAAASAPVVQFTKVQYNSPGSDTRTNASLNGEWFQLTNKTKKSVSLAGWTVKDVAGHTYKFSGSLASGKTVTVHTGKGTLNKPSGHRYWGSQAYIWNNTGDTATLRTGKGTVVHKCSWGSTGSATSCTPKPAPTKPSTKPVTKPPTPATPTRPPAPSTTAPAPTTTAPPATFTDPPDEGGEDTPPPVIG
jgi:hypothetical protein